MMVFEKWESTIMAWDESTYRIFFLAKLRARLCSELIPVEVSGALKLQLGISPASGRNTVLGYLHVLKIHQLKTMSLLWNKHLSSKIHGDGFNDVNFQNKTRKLLSLCWDTASENSQGGGVQSPALADAKLYNPYKELMNACAGNGTWGNYWHTFY